MLKLLTSNNLINIQQGLSQTPTLDVLQQLADANPTSPEAVKWQQMMTLKTLLEEDNLNEAVAEWDPTLALPLLCVLSNFDVQALNAGYTFQELMVERTLQLEGHYGIGTLPAPNQHLGVIVSSGGYCRAWTCPDISNPTHLLSAATFLLDNWNNGDVCDVHELDVEGTKIIDEGSWFIDANRKLIAYSSDDFPPYEDFEDELDELIEDTWCDRWSLTTGYPESTFAVTTIAFDGTAYPQSFLWAWLIWKGIPIHNRPACRPHDDVLREGLLALVSEEFGISAADWSVQLR